MRAQRPTDPVAYADATDRLFWAVMAPFRPQALPEPPEGHRFYAERCQGARGPVLELGCGTGELSSALARIGLEVVAVDRVSAMLQEARRRADALPNRERERLAWVQADLRRLRLSRRFDRVLLPLGTWESLLTPEDQLQALRVVRAHLSPAGLAFLDLSDLSPEELIGEPVRGTAPLFFLSESLAPNGEREETLALFFTRRLDLDRQWRIEEYTLERFDRGGKLRGRLHVPRIRRWSHRYEMEHLFARAGLEPVELLGDFSSGPFAAGGRQIWTLRIVEPTG